MLLADLWLCRVENCGYLFWGEIVEEFFMEDSINPDIQAR